MELKELPRCTSCKKFIIGNKGISFTCPNCGEVIIYRCNYCRKRGVIYVCPKCGFEGPL